MQTNQFLKRDHFLLGTFSTNCSGGMTVSKLPNRWKADWESNLKIGKLLDEAGIDFMLPIARWIGYGGETDFHGYVLETVTWATALLANTKQLTVFATIHTAANHPVVVAKQIATMPPIYNAAGSGLGREFAAHNADFLFTPAIDLARSKQEVSELKQQALEQEGRKVGVLTFAHVICRPTEAEAQKVWQSLQDNADWEATDNLIRLQFAHAQSFPHDLLQLIRERFAAGHGGFPLVGTPEQVADGMTQLHEAGFSGTTLSFFDYAEEFPYFRDNVLPILESRGIRRKFV